MTLTVALTILAALVLAAVVAHGAWQARRRSAWRPRQPVPERSRDSDISRPLAPGSERLEPTLSHLDDTLDTQPEIPFAVDDAHEPELPPAHALGSADDVAPVDLAEPEWADTRPPPVRPAGAAAPIPPAPQAPVSPPVFAAPTPPAAPAHAPPAPAAAPRAAAPAAAPGASLLRRPRLHASGPVIDALIDAIATLRLDAPISGAMLLQHLPPTHRAGGKPFFVEGLSATTGEWEPPREAGRYGEVQVGLQMANRHGALNEIEYSEFVQKIQPLADAIGAEAQFPDMLDAVAQARELDAFASQHDAQLGAQLRANSVAWSLAYVEQCATRHGFVPGNVPGRLVLPAAGAPAGSPPLVVLGYDPQVALADDAGQSALRELTLTLDVPQSPESTEPFVAWQQSARRLAEDLDATLVDEQGYPITLQAFAAIGQELTRLYAALAARELQAGSPAARRLFS